MGQGIWPSAFVAEQERTSGRGYGVRGTVGARRLGVLISESTGWLLYPAMPFWVFIGDIRWR